MNGRANLIECRYQRSAPGRAPPALDPAATTSSTRRRKRPTDTAQPLMQRLQRHLDQVNDGTRRSRAICRSSAGVVGYESTCRLRSRNAGAGRRQLYAETRPPLRRPHAGAAAPAARLDAGPAARSLWRMHPDEFRRHAHALVDWMADYLRDVGTLPDHARGRAGRHPPPAPRRAAASTPSRSRRCSTTSARVIVPGMTHWNHPGLVRLLPLQQQPAVDPGRDAHRRRSGAQGMSWATSPAATELEQVVMDWLRQMIGPARGLRRRHPGHGLDRHAAWPCSPPASARRGPGRRAERGSPRPGRRSPCTRRARRTPRSTRRSSSPATGSNTLRPIETDDGFAHAARCARASARSGPRGGLRPACVVATVGTTSSHGHRPPCGRSPSSAGGTARGCTWTPRTRAPPRSCRSCARCSTAWSRPTASSSTRTSGC